MVSLKEGTKPSLQFAVHVSPQYLRFVNGNRSSHLDPWLLTPTISVFISVNLFLFVHAWQLHLGSKYLPYVHNLSNFTSKKQPNELDLVDELVRLHHLYSWCLY